jgi:hypothetical protein
MEFATARPSRTMWMYLAAGEVPFQQRAVFDVAGIVVDHPFHFFAHLFEVQVIPDDVEVQLVDRDRLLSPGDQFLLRQRYVPDPELRVPPDRGQRLVSLQRVLSQKVELESRLGNRAHLRVIAQQRGEQRGSAAGAAADKENVWVIYTFFHGFA